MKEINFIRNNIEKWQRAENLVENLRNETPDDIADIYMDITADLAFAYTHYPKSQITLYLNNLAQALHNSIYVNKVDRLSRFVTFWTKEVPLVMYDARKLLLLSFLIFIFSVFVGVVSQLADDSFCRLILGDGYVDMTLENIAEGTPMAVYNGEKEVAMTFGITVNNIYVSFLVFAFGIFTSMGTAWQLFRNGVMMGCFMTFFYQYDLLWEAFLAVFLHGTLELSAIIIAGAAGLSLGNGWLFPGTYKRLTSFRMGAKRGLKIVVGTVPVFIVAGFVEGVLTRHTEIPDAIRLSFILLSLAFIVYYFIVLPIVRHRKQNKNIIYENTETKD